MEGAVIMYSHFVKQIYHTCGGIALELLTAEQAAKRRYISGYHKECYSHVLHVTGFTDEAKAQEFIEVVKKG